MERIIKAFFNSARALKRLLATEPAFRQEAILLVLAIPAGWFLAAGWTAYFLLLGSLLFLMVVETLNTAVEKACDAVSRDFRHEIQLAKDCGSLAVLIAAIMAAAVWVGVIWQRFAGA